MALGRRRGLEQKPARPRDRAALRSPGLLVLLATLLIGLPLLALYYFSISNAMGSITGIIRDAANNAPLEDVNMVIVSGPSHPDIVALTDSRGRFSFENLRPGDYILKAYGRVESDDIPVRLFRHKTPFVEIWLEANRSDQGENVIGEESYFLDDTQLREDL